MMALSPPITPQGTLIRLAKNQAMPTIYDVEMEGIDQLQQYDRVECHTVLYPYSRQVSSEDISFYPFEEYVSDLASHQRSAYAEIHSPSAQICGLLLGGIIALVFAIVKPDEFLSIESLVSILAAYAIGKEFWDDIERGLIDLSRNWRLRVADVIYRYQLEKDTTLSAYFFLAKQRRYGKVPLLPDKMDFVKQSNSQTLRMCFARRDLAAFADASAHVHSIHIDPALLPELEGAGFMFGVKVSLGRTRWGITRNLELFQCIDKTPTDQASIGCLDAQGNWVEGALFYRNTLTCGRIKHYIDQGLVPGRAILASSTG